MKLIMNMKNAMDTNKENFVLVERILKLQGLSLEQAMLDYDKDDKDATIEALKKASSLTPGLEITYLEETDELIYDIDDEIMSILNSKITKIGLIIVDVYEKHKDKFIKAHTLVKKMFTDNPFFNSPEVNEIKEIIENVGEEIEEIQVEMLDEILEYHSK